MAALRPASRWLADRVNCVGSTRRGSVASISESVHASIAFASFPRARATSAGETSPAALPKLLRTDDAMPATHSSGCAIIGTITSEYVLSPIGPVSP